MPLPPRNDSSFPPPATLPTPPAPTTTLGIGLSETFVPHLDQGLGQGYRNYWGLSPNADPSLSDIQALLRQVKLEKRLNFAVIYAVFLPVRADGTLTIDPLNPATDLENRLTQISENPQESDRLVLVLVPPTGQALLKPIGMTRQQVVSQARLFRMATEDIEDFQSFQPLARQFYDWLLRPFTPELERLEITNLIYVLDAGLRTTPIAAMMDGSSYVVEHYGVSVVPSLGLTDTRLTKFAPQTGLLMGINQFQPDQNLEPLPAIATELQEVSATLALEEVRLNEESTLDNLVNLQERHTPEILHLATHAAFNPGQPSQSYIQLWDQKLTLPEVRALAWNPSQLGLLTLSACSTAVGDYDAELGFTGLAAAVGVRSSLGSLWSISDTGTLALMSEFYGYARSAEGLSQALRKAQLSLLRGETRIVEGQLITTHGSIPLPPELRSLGTETFQHPFFWSAFTLVGSPW
jgi:CHAT domain-containing protein